MPYGTTSHDPYEGTVIGADGNRHDPEGDVPTVAPAWPGRPLRQGNIDEVVGTVLPARNGVLTITRTTTGGADLVPTLDGVAGTAFNAPVAGTTAAAFKASLAASLSNLAPADFTLTGANGGAWTFTATSDGAWGDQELPTLSFAGGTGGSVTVEVVEPGREATIGLDGLVAVAEDASDRLETAEDDITDLDGRVETLENA